MRCHRAIIGLGLAAASEVSCAQSGAFERIETTSAILTLKAVSGDLIGLQWKRPKLDIASESRLGENFRILLPRTDYEANYFNSRDQVLRTLEKSADRIVLRYGPLRNEREEVNVHVVYEIRDTGTQLQFNIQVSNATDRNLAEVFYGIIGGQQGIAKRLDTESVVPGINHRNLAPKLFSHFDPVGETFAVQFGQAGYAYPGDMSMGWLDIYNPKIGLGYYYANQDPATRLTALYSELHPYSKLPNTNSPDTWPHTSVGQPVGLVIGWVNFPYIARGTFRGGPIALQVHFGDWHSGAEIYRAWFDEHFNLGLTSTWVRDEMAWQSVDLLSADDRILHSFKELPKLAADAKRYGVTTVNILGWTFGGYSRGGPNSSIDRRLGTADDLKDAFRRMRDIGVHPLLTANFLQADTSVAE